MAAAPGDDDRGLWIISLGFGAMLGYLLLQPLVAFRWSGRWRLAGLAPLVLTLPLAAYTLTALAAGSNLWPLAALFLTPVAFVYLLLLASLRLLLGGPQAV